VGEREGFHAQKNMGQGLATSFFRAEESGGDAGRPGAGSGKKGEVGGDRNPDAEKEADPNRKNGRTTSAGKGGKSRI